MPTATDDGSWLQGRSGDAVAPSPAARWRAEMRRWVLPEEILAAAPESPWGFPVELFGSRVEHAVAGTVRFSDECASEALGGEGTVLDVGVGGGAGSLPLRERCSSIVGVDASRELLAEFRRQAQRVGVPVETVEGAWPEVEGRAPMADVVVCHHVAYNVADLAPFVAALSAHARRRVVMEMTSHHPTAWMTDLWLHFWRLPRPSGPDAEDAVAVARELGAAVEQHTWVQPRRPGGFPRREDAVAWIRRRLCLDASRDAEVAAVLGDRLARNGEHWTAGPPEQPVVTLWWDVSLA